MVAMAEAREVAEGGEVAAMPAGVEAAAAMEGSTAVVVAMVEAGEVEGKEVAAMAAGMEAAVVMEGATAVAVAPCLPRGSSLMLTKEYPPGQR